ncbi:MAG: FtsX-like permease family protein [Chloroflexi bacterium]|nr:FtsX-like permease family protein [Chloroflexota bacterium]
MTELFGIPLLNFMIGGLVLMGIAFAVLGWIAWKNPLLVRMGLRNAVRRKAQTTLIVIGLMLSTLIISAAFATGDTVGYSITNAVYSEFAQADLVIARNVDRTQVTGEGISSADLAALKTFLASDQDVDGIAGIVQERIPALNAERRLSEPRAVLAGVDPPDMAGLKSLLTPAGAQVSPASLTKDGVFISQRLSEDIGLGKGQQLTVFANNQPATFTVLEIVQDNALTASSVSGDRQQPAGGIVATREVVNTLTGKGDRYSLIVVSVTGGFRDTLDVVPGVETRLKEWLKTDGAPALRVVSTKEQAVSIAELVGSIFVTFFLLFGLFSIAAGIMLIFLTFVMLAAERRSEMGMARAVGMKRSHLTQSFIAEGMAYNVGSALIGAILGLVVAYILITILGNLFGDFGLNIAFHFNPQGFVIAYALGVVITFATVAFSSWRAANLNIVRAIRDLPEPQPLRGHDRTISGLLRATIGAAWYIVWLLLVGLGAALGVQAFIFGLGYFALPFLAYLGVVAFFIYGARGAAHTRLWLPARGAARIVGAALSILTLPLRILEGAARALMSDGRIPGRIARAAWWVTFSPVALITWGLLRTRGWANRHRNPGGWAVVMLITGMALTVWGGWSIHQAFAYTGGATLAILAVAMLAVYFGAASRPAFTIASMALLWYWLLPLPFSLLFEAGKGWGDPLNGLAGLVGMEHEPVKGNIEMFFVSGLCITASATLFVIFNADLILALLGRSSGVFRGITPAVRTAIAYPLAAKFRTGMTLAMFGLVMFSLVVMATLNHNFSQLFLGDDASGGFQVAVAGNPTNRIPDLRNALKEAGQSDTGITGVGTLVQMPARVRLAEQDLTKTGTYRIAGADAEFLRVARFPLSARADGYATDADVFAAMEKDPTLALVDESRLAINQQNPFGGNGDTPQQFIIERDPIALKEQPWQPIPAVIRDPRTGAEANVKIVGFVDQAVTGVIQDWASVFVGRQLLDQQFKSGTTDLFFLTTSDTSVAGEKRVADAVESALLEKGVQASSIRERIEDSAAQAQAFQTLFQGFMGLGMIVGIAALGVIAFRTVAERRQQIGMLRAIGYSRRLVAITFFLESSFIAITGIGMGLLLGSALSYNLMTSPDFTNGSTIDYGVPWGRLIFIVSIAYGASALMTLIPARSASRVPVAEALRYNG